MRGPLLMAAATRGLLSPLTGGDAGGPLARVIRAKLAAALEPTHLEVLDDSSRHGGPPGAETHFGVVVVSARFEGLPPLQRHRLVHAALRRELAGPLHALAIVARTPQQWERDPRAPSPPPCLGGSKHERRRAATSDESPSKG